MAHSEHIISSIKLPGDPNTYQVHDAQAIHNIEELGLSAALVFKGTKSTESAIFGLTSAKVGDVWLCTENQTEYICVTTINGSANTNAWEKLGNIHDAASTTHTHGVNVTGSNQGSTVTGVVTVPTVSSTKKYMVAGADAPEITAPTDSVLGADTIFTLNGSPSTTYIKATATGAAVGAATNGTAEVISGFGTHSTKAALGVDATFSVSGGGAVTSKMSTTTIKNPSTVTTRNIPNVAGTETVTASKVSGGNVSGGTAASWGASVENGVLTFSWTANRPTSVTLPTATDVSATKVTMGNAIPASEVSTTNVTVATGTLSSSGQGASVATGVNSISVTANNKDSVTAITGLGTASKKTVLTGVQVTAQPTIKLETSSTSGTGYVNVVTGMGTVGVSANGDNVSAVTSVSAKAPVVTLTQNSTSTTNSVPVVTEVSTGTTSASLTNGYANPQTWSQTSGSTTAPNN